MKWREGVEDWDSKDPRDKKDKMFIEVKEKKRRKVKCNPHEAENGKKSDLQLLDGLIEKFFEKLKRKGFEPTAQDMIRAIQLK